MNHSAQEQWRRLEQLFVAGLEVPAAEREDWLRAQCPEDEDVREELRRMWKADAGAEGQLAGVVGQASQSLLRPESMAGERIGPYVLVREVGRGGMGAVYQAVRADGEFHQAVAIKIIKRGMDTDAILKRFRQERHILARLHHSHIARLLDAGTTVQGQPYLVMDYVEGRSLLDYCRAMTGDAEPVLRQKLELFLQIADAVQHAHDKLIIHRDLKPSNILVSAEGEAKLLDFGIAKWIDPALAPETAIDTLTGQMALTPDYASPEQKLGQPVTERTDVFGLGTILLEMASRSSAQAETGKALPRELQAIIAKAREEDPRDRYASVAELRADVENYLAQRPVLAYQGRWAYRTRKVLHRHRAKVLLSSLATVSCLAAFWLWWSRQAPMENPNSIAVLPFVSLTPGAEGEALARGLHEDLIASLAGLPPLRVLSRGAVQKYLGRSVEAREAGRELGAEAVLEGSIRQANGQIRVVAQLVSVRDGFHIWAQSYDRRVTNSLAVQSELSRLIAGEIATRLRREKDWRRNGRSEPQGEAYAAYLEAYRLFNHEEIRKEWKSGLPPRMLATIAAFEKAIRLDENFAGAQAGLAEALEWASTFDDAQRERLLARSKQAADRALALDPENALAHLTLGNIYKSHDWDLRRAESYLRRAVELNPSSTGTQTDYADVLTALGRYAEAIATLERVQLFEANSPRPVGHIALLKARLGDVPGARAAARLALDRDPRYRHALLALAYADELEGRYAEAESGYRKTLSLFPTEHRTLAYLGSLLARRERLDEAKQIAAQLEDLIARGRRREVFAAMVHVALGEKAVALGLLEKAWERRDPNLQTWEIEKNLKPLSGEAAYLALTRKLLALR